MLIIEFLSHAGDTFKVSLHFSSSDSMVKWRLSTIGDPCPADTACIQGFFLSSWRIQRAWEVLSLPCFQVVPYRWVRNHIWDSHCCGRNAGFLPPGIRSCPVAGWAKLTHSQWFGFTLRRMSPSRYPFSSLPFFPFHPFSSLPFVECASGTEASWTHTATAQDLAWLFKPVFWSAGVASWGPSVWLTPRWNTFSLSCFCCGISLAALLAYSCGSAGMRLLPAMVLAGWVGYSSAARPVLAPLKSIKLRTEWSWHWLVSVSRSFC